jgi:Ni,Fe-hydrogenase III large subunit
MTNDSRYTEILTNPGTVELSGIPVLEYPAFLAFLDRLMGEEGTHCVSYFVVPRPDRFAFICCMAADENHALVLFSHHQPRVAGLTLTAITARHYQFHVFEREIHEQWGIGFEGHPWLKPVRYPFDRARQDQVMDNYPFYTTTGGQIHEVGVGPVHAGIIEPGYFRFTCRGEQVLHMEIQLGYQHRGIERLMVEKQRVAAQSVLAESIAGDTAIGHALAYAGAIESLKGTVVSPELERERVIALELERVAVHIGDTAALCTDIAYQFGQVVCEALRTIVINTTQLWCGNRFGKGLVRPGGSFYPLTQDLAVVVLKNLKEVEERFLQVADRIFSLPSVLSRFEMIGEVTTMQATLIGAVGMAARSSGMYRDIRWSHPFSGYTGYAYEPVILQKGDVWSRAMLRRQEVEKSLAVIRDMIKGLVFETGAGWCGPEDKALLPSSLAVSLTEGWRGEICHIAVTDETGRIFLYKAKDPSLNNWMALALAVRNQEISDFPLCNKSFNLSYCGHDL